MLARALLTYLVLCATLAGAPLLAQTDGGTWQGGDPPAASPAAPAAASQEAWFVGSTDQQAEGRGGLGKNLQAVRFLGSQFGLAAGHRGLYRSLDGGMTWTKLPGPLPDAGYYDLLAASRTDWWLTSQQHPGGQPGWGHLYHTTDAGATWQEPLAGQLLYAPLLREIGGGTIWAVSYQGDSYQTRDNGATWQPVVLPREVGIRDLCVTGSGGPGDWAAYAVGFLSGSSSGVVLKTTDRGLTWQKLALPLATPPLSRGFFLDPRRGWVAGGDCLLATEDGGQTWEARTNPSPRQPLAALLFLQNGYGWIAYYQPFDGIGKLIFEHTLYSTRDGGRTWRPILSGYKSVHAFYSPGPGACWAVGNTPGYTPNDLVAIWNGKW